jgi:hypothetical protein
VTGPPDAVAQALQRVLASEHAAVYGYPVIGVALRSPGQVRLARQLEERHRHARDELMAQLAARGAAPVPAEASYAPVRPVSGPVDAQRWALSLEENCAGAYRYLLVAPVLAGDAPGSAGTGSGGTSSASTASGATASGAASATPAAGQAGLRQQALTGLTTAALNATEWRRLVSPAAPTTAFPGL